VKPRFALRAPFQQVAFGWLWLAFLVPLALIYAHLNGFAGSEGQFLIRQDLPVFLLCVALLLLLGWAPRGVLSSAADLANLRPAIWPPLLATLSVIIGAAGFWLLFGGYTLSLDEFLADFDAKIFAHGAPMAPVAPTWRPFVPALEPMYTFAVQGDRHWVSAYPSTPHFARSPVS
jgi:hypothetical protein